MILIGLVQHGVIMFGFFFFSHDDWWLKRPWQIRDEGCWWSFADLWSLADLRGSSSSTASWLPSVTLIWSIMSSIKSLKNLLPNLLGSFLALEEGDEIHPNAGDVQGSLWLVHRSDLKKVARSKESRSPKGLLQKPKSRFGAKRKTEKRKDFSISIKKQ